jgi:hypothetical protein
MHLIYRFSESETAVKPSLIASVEPAADRSGSTNAVIDLAPAHRSNRVPRMRELSTEKQTRLTAMHWTAIIYALLATAFYPGVAWLLLHS